MMDRLEKYYRFLRWLVSDLIHYHWDKIILLILSNVVGLIGNATALYLAYTYARSLETRQPFTLFGIVSQSTPSSVLFITSTLVFCLLIISACSINYARTKTIKFDRYYADYCSERALMLASLYRAKPLPLLGACPDKVTISRLVINDSRYCGITARLILNSLLPLGTLLLSGLFLFYLNLELSVIVLGMLGISMFYLFRISIDGAKFRSAIEKRSRPASLERKKLIDRALKFNTGLDSMDEDVRYSYDAGITKNYGDAYEDQLKVMERSVLVGNLAMATAVFLILTVYGNITLHGNAHWSSLLVYLVVLRFFSSSLVNTGRMLTSINRFYPRLSYYARFVHESKNNLSESVIKVQCEDNVFLNAPMLNDDRKPLQLSAGERYSIILPEKINRVFACMIGKYIQIKKNDIFELIEPEIWCVSLWDGQTRCTPRKLLSVPESYTDKNLQHDFNKIGLSDYVKETGSISLDKVISGIPKDIKKLIIFYLSIFAGLARGHSVFLIDEEGLAMSGPKVVHGLLAMLENSLVFVAYCREPGKTGSYGEQNVIWFENSGNIKWAPLETVKKMDMNSLLGCQDSGSMMPRSGEDDYFLFESNI